MREIVPVRKDPNWTSEARCDACGRKVEVERGDLYFKLEDDVGGQRHLVLANCLCGVPITIDDPGQFSSFSKLEQLIEKWGELPHNKGTGVSRYRGNDDMLIARSSQKPE